MATRASSILWLIVTISFLSSIVINLLHYKIVKSRPEAHLSAKNLRTNLKSDFLTQRKSTKNKKDNPKVKDSPKKKEKSPTAASGTAAHPRGQTNPKENVESAIAVSPPEFVTNGHQLANLSCEKYGGPSEQALTDEMVYWSDIPSDSDFVSPFMLAHDEERYLTFEPDGGGWNNIRMAMETVVTMAHAMGRTLVMPPEQRIYLLRKDRGKQKTDFSFADFFHLDSLDKEHSGMNIITMEEFLTRMAMTGKLINKISGTPSFPPNNRTDWNGEDVVPLKEYLREVTDIRDWAPERCLAAFPTAGGADDVKRVGNMMVEVMNSKPGDATREFKGKPVAVDASPVDRLRETRNRRSMLCIYDEKMQKASVVHFMCNHKVGARLLTHFYSFLFFEDWRQDLWTKRFVRDHLRYLDELQCAAARVVAAIRDRARNKNANNQLGLFDTFHIRRGDFQYNDVKQDASVLYENSKKELVEGTTLYIATDERKKDYFDPFKEHYDVCFLDDFRHLFEGLNSNYYGMLDQLIASKGRIFFGTWHSTFTGYINRMRGYHAQKKELEGYEVGAIKSYYFLPMANKKVMRDYYPISGAVFNREFPIAWRDIDKGINELGSSIENVG